MRGGGGSSARANLNSNFQNICSCRRRQNQNSQSFDKFHGIRGNGCVIKSSSQISVSVLEESSIWSIWSLSVDFDVSLGDGFVCCFIKHSNLSKFGGNLNSKVVIVVGF